MRAEESKVAAQSLVLVRFIVRAGTLFKLFIGSGTVLTLIGGPSLVASFAFSGSTEQKTFGLFRGN